MKRFIIFVALLLCSSSARAQFPWSGILNPTSGAGACTFLSSGTPAGCAIDWSQSGIPGGIPTGWTQSGSTIAAGASVATIQAALDACGTNHYVLLGAGTFTNTATLTVHSNCKLLGAGANSTIFNLTGSSPACAVALGSCTAYPLAANAVSVTNGASVGSTSIVVSNAANFTNDQYFIISELNIWPFVSTSGGPGGGNCTFCGIYGWGPLNGTTRSRMQTVHITNISGTTITFSPALFTDYTHTLPSRAPSTKYGYGAYITNGGHFYLQTNNNGSPYTCTTGSGAFALSDGTCAWQDQGIGTTTNPQALPFTASAVNAGVENIQFVSNNTGYGQVVGMAECAGCWMSGNEANYNDGDISDIQYGFQDEVFGNYFSNSYGHTPGSHDSCVNLQGGTSNSRVWNNIFERLHVGVILETGAAGNVIAYNFFQSNFDTSAPYSVFGAIDLHAAMPQFNLIEGNQGATITNDSTWGGNGWGTQFRNWLTGTGLICNPTNSTRGTVVCSPTGYPLQAGTNSAYGFQQSRAAVFDFASWNFNSIGNVIGSTQQQALVNYSNNPLSQVANVSWPTSRSYDATAYSWSFGYSGASDGGGFANDGTVPATTTLVHGDYSNISNAIVWSGSLTHTLPPSFFLSSKPSWWTGTFPAIGPDVLGGTGPGGHVASVTAANPAANCYFNVMGGTNGGAGSPLAFNPSTCYAVAPPPPTITSASSVTCLVNLSCSYQIVATNSPTSYNATGLPSCLAVNTSTGLISGTCTSPATYSGITLAATNTNGTGNAPLTAFVNYFVQANGAASSSVTITPQATGHALYAIAFCGSGATCAIVFSSTSDTWTAPIYGSLGTNGTRLGLSCALSTATTLDTIQATGNGSAGNIGIMQVYETSGPSCNLDITTSPSGGFVTTDSIQTFLVSSGSITTTTANDLVIMTSASSTAVGSPETWSPSSGFLNMTCVGNSAYFANCANPTFGLRTEFQLLVKVTPGTVSGSFTNTAATPKEYATILAAFKPSSATLPVPQNVGIGPLW